MKYYETNFEEYIHAVNEYNIHPEWAEEYKKFPKCIRDFENIIIYGASGVGKYSQMLKLLQPYSPTELKHTKRITVHTEKQKYTYHMSDVHYEVDMSFLGCNSKIVWHELYFQIVDIVCTRPEKTGIIVCKNFHMINTELLDIFYRYIQQYNNSYMNIQIKFVLICDHISFLPTNILEICEILPFERPSREVYEIMVKTNSDEDVAKKRGHILSELDTNDILNLKEIRSFSTIKTVENIPVDIFNIVCDKIIQDIESETFHFLNFRDSLYDILIYNLDLSECFWHIMSHFLCKDKIKMENVTDILRKTYPFLKYYNNNYRPIYHLESIFFYLIMKINNYADIVEKSCIENTRTERKRWVKPRPHKKTIPNVGTEISSG